MRTEIGTTTVFLVSQASRRYSHPDGILQQVSSRDRRDCCSHRFRSNPAPFAINIERDTADRIRSGDPFVPLGW